MGALASQITSLTIVYSTVFSDADQSKHQSSASLAFVWGIHRWPVNSPHTWPITRKMFPFDDVIMRCFQCFQQVRCKCWGHLSYFHMGMPPFKLISNGLQGRFGIRIHSGLIYESVLYVFAVCDSHAFPLNTYCCFNIDPQSFSVSYISNTPKV